MSPIQALNPRGMTTLTELDPPAQDLVTDADLPGARRAPSDPSSQASSSGTSPPLSDSAGSSKRSALQLGIELLTSVWSHFERLDRDRDGRLSREDIESVASGGPHGTLRRLAEQLFGDPTAMSRLNGLTRTHLLRHIAQLVALYFEQLALDDAPKRVSMDDLLIRRQLRDMSDQHSVHAVQRALLETPALFEALASPGGEYITRSSLGNFAPHALARPAAFAAGAVWTVFQALDLNRNGSITKTELSAALRRPGVSKSVRALSTLLLTDSRLFDSLSRGTGFITKASVVRECALRVKQALPSWPRASLNRVTRADLANLVRAKGNPSYLDPSARIVAHALHANPALFALLADSSGAITEQSLESTIGRAGKR